PPRAREARRQLRGPAALGHALRHLREPCARGRPLRLRGGPRGSRRGDAPLRRRPRGGAPMNASFMRRAPLVAILVLGASNAVGGTMGLASPKLGAAIAAPGRMLLAAPAPKVFCKVGDLEPFARVHTVELVYADGRVASLGFERGRSPSLPGPYALRNVYGA